jgi:chemosensory pili system protein ChpA (sensor histidine kinase/response regulator)
MDESFKPGELSEEDLAILQAFDAMDMADWEGADSLPAAPADGPSKPADDQELLSPADMLALFVEEVNADLAAMSRALHRLETAEGLDEGGLQGLQRAAHKVKGTAGAVGCQAMSVIALRMEELLGYFTSGSLAPAVALQAVARTIHALEMTLKSLVTYGHESSAPLIELEAEYSAMQLARGGNAPTTPAAEDEAQTPVRIAFKALGDEEGSPVTGKLAAVTFARVDVRRLESLALHSQHLAELSAPLRNAQAEVEKALQELQAAQARLRQLEVSLSTALSSAQASPEREPGEEDSPTSSLVARILREAKPRHGSAYLRPHGKSRHAARLLQARQSLQWDALDMDHYTENDVLLHAINEAIADVATASAQVRLAVDTLSRLTHQHVDQAQRVRNDTFLLRLSPIGTLLTRIERAIAMSASAQQRSIQFVVEGERTEIDRDVLEELKQPLLQLVRTCLTSRFLAEPATQESAANIDQVWIYVRPVANEVTIELGFSLAVGGGAIEELQHVLRRLQGSITVERNAQGGISFHLRLPRAQGAVQGLLVRVGEFRLLVPFSQVQRIDYAPGQDAPPALALSTLLGCAGDQVAQERVQPPVLRLQPGTLHSVLQVDQVLGDVELVVKPLASYIRRPGIAGAAIDGMGNVLPMIDIFALLRYYERYQRVLRGVVSAGESGLTSTPVRPAILIADDSVYMRRSLRQTLEGAGYQVQEARDGMEALEILLASRGGVASSPPQAPAALVLDLEMPNLNGYDLLSILRVHPELVELKIVMLTSRSSEKHRERAQELGAHAYLTKPCAPEDLLETLRSLLKR